MSCAVEKHSHGYCPCEADSLVGETGVRGSSGRALCSGAVVRENCLHGNDVSAETWKMTRVWLCTGAGDIEVRDVLAERQGERA